MHYTAHFAFDILTFNEVVAMAKKLPSQSKIIPTTTDVLPSGYDLFLDDLKQRVRTSQLKAAIAVNSELIRLYWDIGRSIVERQQQDGWGKAVVDRLAGDIQQSFPGISGFSPRNVWRMRAFFLAYVPESSRNANASILPQAVAEIPWGHNIVLLERIKDLTARLWYVKATKEFGWSRSILEHQIESNTYGRKGKAVTNFEKALPAAQSDLARETLKDPYSFQFLTLAEDHAEADLQRGLVSHIRQFLLELGAGFAYVGERYHLEVGGEDFYLDLVFYHLKLRSFVIFDLKAKRFTPEAAGKMNFYLSAVDDLLRHADDNPSIGIILCKAKNKVIAEYALRDIEKPLAITTYMTRLVESLPDELKKELDLPPKKK